MDPTDALPPLLVVTGAAGRVGRIVVPDLAERYRLRLVDLDGSEGGEPGPEGAERLTVDLRRPDGWSEALDSADLVLHLAAQPSPEIDLSEAWADVARPAALLAAAAPGTGVRRVVLASSVHAAGLYARRPGTPIRPDWPARPCCEYGVAKVLAENLLRLTAERSAVTVACLRLGLTGAAPGSARAGRQWLGDDDCRRLVRAALAADVAYGVYFGMSAAGTGDYDLGNARRQLGYRPREWPIVPTGPVAEEGADPDRRCRMR